MLTYPNLDLNPPRSDFSFFPIGSQNFQCEIWVGKHNIFLFLRHVLNSPDQDVLKTGVKSWFGAGTVKLIFSPPENCGSGRAFFPIGLSALQRKIWVGKHSRFLLLRPFLKSPDRDVLKNGVKSWFGGGTVKSICSPPEKCGSGGGFLSWLAGTSTQKLGR